MEDITKENFLRCNKVRRLQLARNAGYIDIESFYKARFNEKYVEKHKSRKTKESKIIEKFGPEIKEKIINKDKKTIYNLTLGDASGSMHGNKYGNSCKGIKKEAKEFRSNDEVTIIHSIYEFSNATLEVLCKNTETPDDIQFNGANGGTPLWSSIIKVLNDYKHITDEKVLMKIYTDGGDTDSTKEQKIQCRNLIKELNARNFTITFVATKEDIQKIIKDMELDESNTLAIDNTGKGFETAFNTSLQATIDYSKKVVAGEDVKTGFYKKIIK